MTFDEPTPVTREYRLDDADIPPLPSAPVVIYHARVPWWRIVLLCAAVDLALQWVMRGFLR